ncbi:hypothetical protein PFTANZ_02096, partial [Plasmodium falciparum Tanzania (2000708)]
MGSGKGGGTQDAKHVLDEFGQKVHDEIVKNGGDDAKKYIKELEGDLKKATISHSELVAFSDPCELVKEYYERANGDGERHPCRKENVNRFSDTLGGQCTDHRIKGNDRNVTGGACAPLRRLHVCDRNLENINDVKKIDTKDNLLLEVCMAAYYEGQSIKEDHVKYHAHNPDFNTTICTELARSFADIGDIVRGKDLYLGYDDEEKKQRDQLENKLKEVFGKIHGGLSKNGAKDRYNGDGEDYYQLREDWWNANRQQVWKAITCKATDDDKYFRKTCGKNDDWTGENCRCAANIDPPTYFDYVPQFLRWFEEWAEDFCRKRKHKLENAITNCRKPNGKDKYCSGNGYDCTKTIYKKGKLVIGEHCTSCSVWCRMYEKWIDNQKKEFLKQKRKYTKEMQKYTKGESRGTGGSKRKKRSARVENHEGYHKEFYNKLKERDYKDVKNFLKILNKEGLCEKKPKVKGETADSIDFKNENTEKTFSRTEICEPCPWCGLQSERPPWTPKEEKECRKDKKKTYKPDNITKIPVLTPEKLKKGILKKYSKFCKNGANGEKSVTDGGQIEKWECYYDEIKESGQNNNCILGDWQKVNEENKIMSYNAFFWKWVHDMLIDSIEWRNEHGNCINKKQQSECIPACKKTCDCFQKWVKKKETEWGQIKIHFRKQKDIGNKEKYGSQALLGEGMTHDFVLDELLKKEELLKIIKETYGNADETEHIKKLLDETAVAGVAGGVVGGENNTTIDKLLKHEEKDAKDCLEKQEECERQKQLEEQESRGRSEDFKQPTPSSPDPTEEKEEDDEDEEDDEEEEEEEEGGSNHQEALPDETEVVEETVTEQDGATEAPEVKKEEVKVCETVKKALKVENLTQACTQKYGYPQRHWGWKCIPSGDKIATDSKGDGEPTRGSGDTTGGSICVPPRRRRLYVGKLHDWAEKTQSSQPQAGGGSESTSDGKTATQPQGGTSSTSEAQTASDSSDQTLSDSDKLREAFIQSAAIETFFLWDRYKKIKEKEKKEKEEKEKQDLLYISSDDNDNPQSKLQKSGTIPTPFLRQMFYTLGDYRDICVGKTPDGIDTVSASDKDTMEKIKKAIDTAFNSGSEKNPSSSPPDKKTTAKQWWENNAKYIWEGMVCALSYDTNTKNGETPKRINGADGTDLFQKLKENNDYETVKLENSDTEAMSNDPLNNPKLSDFVKIPPFFRWLHEWGNDFCGKRARMLEKIKEECVKNDGGRCSGDGEHCEDNLRGDPSTVPTFYCTSCSKPCGLYKRWIQRKSKEFEEQKSAYTEQKDKCVNGSNKGGGNGFCGTIKTTYTTAADFLKTLGPCSKPNNAGSEITFDDSADTFEPAKDCKPCSKFKIDCEKGNCTGGGTKVECNGRNKTFISADDIKNNKDSAEDIGMLVSDKGSNVFEGDGLEEACKNANIFEAIRKDEWTCGKVCGYNVCKPKKVNGKIVNGKPNGENQIIIIRALFKRWLEYFLEDYNKINAKISYCKENGGTNICIKNCADKWIKLKKEEWGKIKKHYETQNEDGDTEMISLVKNFLRDVQPQTDVNKAIKPCDGLENFEKSKECAVDANSKSGEVKKKDIVECLLKMLGEKAKKCAENHAPTSGIDCTTPPTTDTPLDEEPEDILLEEDEQNPVGKQEPSFCPPQPKETKKEEEDDCKPAPTIPEAPEPAPPADSGKEIPVLNPEKEAPEPEKKVTPVPKRQPKKPRPKTPKDLSEHPAVIPSLATSTLMWSIGIGFAAFTYFFLKVNG